METKMGAPEKAEIAFRRKIAYSCCMRKTFVILLAVAAVCGCLVHEKGRFGAREVVCGGLVHEKG